MENLDFFINKAKRANERYVADSHYHNAYEIYYLVSGTRRYLVNHTIYDIKKDDMILIPKGTIHRTTSLQKHTHTRFLINFSDEFVQSICSEMGKDAIGKVFEVTKISVPESRREYVLGLFERMKEENETYSADGYSTLLIKNYLSELFVFINRYNKKASPEIEIPEEKIQKAAKYIYENYNKDITLADVANYVYMSESYFSKKFKRETGLKFSEYLTNIRIKKADEMLLETQLPISEIAALCGFRESNYFGDVFKKLKGISPNKYRKFKGKI
ncbi:MAG: helix-turn-helix transcriptional regulator [Clostridia bacterium]|nr:helix-turn-helix transcriptional regulator [Clostridia bacterium]